MYIIYSNKSLPLNGSVVRHGLLCVDVGGRESGRTIAAVKALGGQPEYCGGEGPVVAVSAMEKGWQSWRSWNFSNTWDLSCRNGNYK